MRILALALVLVTPMATPTAATESDDPEDVVLEFVDAVLPRLAGARIPCEEDLIATTRSAGVGVLCFRPVGRGQTIGTRHGRGDGSSKYDATGRRGATPAGAALGGPTDGGRWRRDQPTPTAG